jgi:hypothetical protein
LSNLL